MESTSSASVLRDDLEIAGFVEGAGLVVGAISATMVEASAALTGMTTRVSRRRVLLSIELTQECQSAPLFELLGTNL